MLYDMPAASVGPVQLYPTPDSMHVWVADQGVLDGQPAGNQVHRMTADGAFDLAATVATAPHGVVVDQLGDPSGRPECPRSRRSASLPTDDAVLSSVPVGEEPNGITCLHGSAAMP